MAAGLGGIVQLLDDVGGGAFIASDTYVALTGSTNYGFTGSGFTLNTTGCILTYTGPSGGRFLVIGAASNSVPPGNTALSSWAIAHNGDLIGQAILGGATGPAGGSLVNLLDTNDQLQSDTMRLVTLNNGDTLQPVGASSGASSTFSMTTFSIALFPI